MTLKLYASGHPVSPYVPSDGLKVPFEFVQSLWRVGNTSLLYSLKSMHLVRSPSLCALIICYLEIIVACYIIWTLGFRMMTDSFFMKVLLFRRKVGGSKH